MSEKDGERVSEKDGERVSEKDGERETDVEYGMTGALAPFSYLVYNRGFIHNPSLSS